MAFVLDGLIRLAQVAQRGNALGDLSVHRLVAAVRLCVHLHGAAGKEDAGNDVRRQERRGGDDDVI